MITVIYAVITMIAAPISECDAVIAEIRSLRTCGATAAASGLVRVTTAFGSDCLALQVLDGALAP